MNSPKITRTTLLALFLGLFMHSMLGQSGGSDGWGYVTSNGSDLNPYLQNGYRV